MSSSHHTLLNQNFDEQRWIINIRRALDEDLEQEPDTVHVSIFNVPKSLMLLRPDSYTPQQIALGPYHHSRPELYEMERYKISAAKRFQKQLQNVTFQNLIDHLTKFEPIIRASYHKFINLNGETVTWMMAVDSCFLLQFLNIYEVKEKKVLSRVSASMSHLVDMTGQKWGHNAIVRDMVMLENQIPLFFLRKILEFQFESIEETENTLYTTSMGFCKEILPFKMIQKLPSVHQVMECSHLLDLLYHLIVPKSELSSEITLEVDQEQEAKGEVNKFWSIIPKFKQSPVSLVKKIFVSKPVQFILSIPCKIIANLPVVIMVKQFEYLCFSQETEKNTQENGNCDSNNINRPPLIEEIEIPSVTELLKAGIKFSATNSGIFSINFDDKIATFFLPVISLDCNTEVAMRNLVAYETCSASRPLIFTRYTELMNGIIDNEGDAKILRERGIILNRLKSDEDVANLWNGMSKSIRLTKVPFLDKVIQDVNLYYNGKWRVRIGKFMARNVFASWQSLTLVVAILLLGLMSMQVFYSVVSYSRLFLYRKRMN